MQNSRLKAGLAAVLLGVGAPLAAAQPMPAPPAEFTAERRDALRRIWQTDAAIRDHVDPGDEDRMDASSDFYAEDYTARQSLAAAPPPEAGLAMAAGREQRP